jgi:asparagine synthase (glutamine-hydrolysing)
VDRLCCNNETSIPAIKVALEAAVHRQLMSDVPYGYAFWRFRFSITSAIAKKYAQNVLSQAMMRGIHNCIFSVGLEGSPICAAANSSRSYRNHSSRNKFTIQEGLDAIKM